MLLPIPKHQQSPATAVPFVLVSSTACLSVDKSGKRHPHTHMMRQHNCCGLNCSIARAQSATTHPTT
jgi:hypothetical protein